MAQIATIQILVEADSPAEAADFMSETLRDMPGVLDWSYFNPEVMQLTPTDEHGYCSPTEREHGPDYEEGNAFFSEKV